MKNGRDTQKRDGTEHYLQSLVKHPSLVALSFFVYLAISFLASFLSFLLAILVDVITNYDYVAEAVYYLLMALLLLIIWMHYIYINIFVFAKSIVIKGDLIRIKRVVQLFLTTTFTFAIFFYFLQLYSNNSAFHGMHPIKESTGRIHSIGSLLDRTFTIPEWQTIVDVIYCSFCTISNLGYGGVYPVSPIAKLVSSVEVIIGILIIVFSIGSLLGNNKDERGNAKVICSAITTKGTRCTRETSNTNGRCWQHPVKHKPTPAASP